MTLKSVIPVVYLGLGISTLLLLLPLTTFLITLLIITLSLVQLVISFVLKNFSYVMVTIVV